MTDRPQIPRYTLARGLRSFAIGTLIGLVLMLLFSSQSLPYLGTDWRNADSAEQAFAAAQGRGDRAGDCERARAVAAAWQQAGYPDKQKQWQARADGLCNAPATPD